MVVNNNNATVEILSGTLGMMDLDMALREDEPPKPIDESTKAKRAHYAKWERSNRLSLISIKRSIAEHLLGGPLLSISLEEYLRAIMLRNFWLL